MFHCMTRTCCALADKANHTVIKRIPIRRITLTNERSMSCRLDEIKLVQARVRSGAIHCATGTQRGDESSRREAGTQSPHYKRVVKTRRSAARILRRWAAVRSSYPARWSSPWTT